MPETSEKVGRTIYRGCYLESICGATGFIGARLLENLEKTEGLEIIALVAKSVQSWMGHARGT